MKRVLVVAPGRGAYGPGELGSLVRTSARPALAEARERVLPVLDARRRELDRAPISVLDAAGTFAAIHIAAENASALTFGLSAVEGSAILDSGRVDPVALCGNSLGWYTALFLAGALDLADAHEIVETMATLQAGDAESGGQSGDDPVLISAGRKGVLEALLG